jgi:hypothetical protein
MARLSLRVSHQSFNPQGMEPTMIYSVTKNGALMNSGLNRRQAVMRLNSEMQKAVAAGLAVSVRGVNDDMRLIVTNGATYEMRKNA